MNKTAKVIIGVVVIAALVVGGLYFSGVIGDGGQGFLKKGNFKVDYDKNFKNVKKLPKAPKLPEACTYSNSILAYDQSLLMRASVPCDYANAIFKRQGRWADDIISLWKAGVPLEYFMNVADECGFVEASVIIKAYKDGVAPENVPSCFRMPGDPLPPM